MNEPRNTNVQVHGKDNEKKTTKTNMYGTSKTSGLQTNIYFRWLSVSSSERDNEAKRQRKAIKSHLFIIFVSDFACFSAITMNIIVSFFLGQNLRTIMHGLLPGHLKQILFCLLSLGISVSVIGQRHKVEQRENQGLKKKIKNTLGKFMLLLIYDNLKSIRHLLLNIS